MAQTPGGRITRSRSQTPAAVPTVAVGSSTAYGAAGRANLRTQVTSERQTLSTAFHSAQIPHTSGRAGSRAPSAGPDADIDDAPRDSKTPSRRGRPPKSGKRTELTIQEQSEDEHDQIDEQEGNEVSDDPARRKTVGVGGSQRWGSRNANGGLSPRFTTAQLTGRGTFLGPAGRTTGASAKPLFQPPKERPGEVYPTFIDNDAGYGQFDQQQQAPQQVRPTPATPLDRTAYEPTWIENFLVTLQRWTPAILLQATGSAAQLMRMLWYALLTLIAMLAGLGVGSAFLYLIMLVASAIPNINFPSTLLRPDGHARMTTLFDAYMEHRDKNKTGDPVQDAVEMQGAIMFGVTDLYTHVNNMSNVIVDLAEHVYPMKAQLTIFMEKVVPNVVVVGKTEAGDWELPTHFWQALAAEIKQPDSTIYKTFLETNQAQVEALLSGGPDSPVHGKLKEQMHIISRDMIKEEVEAQYLKWEAELSTKTLESLKQEVELQVEKATGLKGENGDKERYLKSVFFTNQAEFFGHRNWFAYNAGAQIDVRLTSPSYDTRKPGLARLLGRSPNPPVAALTRWEEAGEAWCGANNTDGHLQLAIRLRQPVVPRDVYFEHIHRTMTDDIAAAPREVEFWGEGSGAQPEGAMCKTPPPTDKHVCLGVGEYDIHGWNWVQKFLLDQVDFAVSEVVIRVVSNWGADHTCIYRVRMHGRGN